MSANSVSLEKYTSKYFGEFLADDSITEICYNGDDKIYTQDIHSFWSVHETELNFDGASAFAQAAAAFKEDQIDRARPILSCILPSGQRTQIVMPPAAKRDHISITIRKPSKVRFTIDNYKKSGIFDSIKPDSKAKEQTPQDSELIELYEGAKWDEFITKATTYGKNIVICGETGSGKTTFMKSLIDYIPLSDRLITIEDVEEIVFYEHKNFVQLFYPSEAKSDDFLNPATLLKSCLRMKPDRILLAEVRGAETYDFINVLASGHKGSLTSCHAGGSKDCFKRLAMMILQNEQGKHMPYDVIEKTLFDVIDIVVHLYAHAGKRHISEIYFKELSKEKI